LTLDRAVTIALKNNPGLSAGAWRVAAARARARLAWWQHFPTLDLNLAYRHHWHQERLVPMRKPGAGAIRAHDVFSGDVVLKVPILAGGRVMSTAEAYKLMAEARTHRLKRSTGELRFNVKSTFFAILGQQKLVTATERSIGALREHLRVTRALIAARKAAPVDRLNLEVRLAQLNAKRATQRGDLRIHERLLASLMGLESLPAGGLELQGRLSEPPVSLDGERLLREALQARPEVAALNLELQAQARRVDAVRAEYWPVLSASLTYGARLSGRGEYDDLGFAGIAVSYPVLGWLSTRARVQEERAKLRALEQERRTLGLSIRQEVDAAIVGVRAARVQAAATRKAIRAARESLRIAREKAAQARGTTMEVLDAQAALLGSEAYHMAALVSLKVSLARLDLATGRAP